MPALKKIVVAGATGNIGVPVLSAILATRAFEVTALSRKESTAIFPKGVHVVPLDYNSRWELVNALTGQDAVVSTLGAMALDSAQMNLVFAAAVAKIKLFIPSEFGLDTTSSAAVAAKVFASKPAELKTAGVPYTVLMTGPFLDWGLANGFLGINARGKAAYLIDDGNAKVSGTSLTTISRAVVAILQRPEQTRNRRLYVSDAEFTQNELLAAVQARVGAEGWNITRTSLAIVRAEGLENMAGPRPSQFGIIQLIRSAVFSGTETCYWADRDNSDELGLIQIPLNKIVAKAIAAL